MTLASGGGGVRYSRLWSTSQLLRPSGQPCSHSRGDAYVGVVEEMMCVVYNECYKGAIVVMDMSSGVEFV